MNIPFLIDDIRPTLIDAITRSKTLRATTAFWTIDVDYFNGLARTKFIEILKEKDSFFITDISEPTIIENVVHHSEQGAHMWFYLKRAKDNLLRYDHLLHSKIFLFENSFDDDATLILGSANMTNRALSGINQEAGVSINLKKSDLLYVQVVDYLNSIKRDSIEINPGMLDIYKFIQDQGNLENFFSSCPLLYVVANTPEYKQCANNEIIQLLGLNDETFKFFDKIQSLSSKIAILIEDQNTNETKVCVCDVVSTGEIKINENKTYGKDYTEKRMYFYLGLSKITGASTPAYLFPEDKITQPMFYIADFHAELEVIHTFNSAYEKSDVLKNKLNPWEEVKIIEDEKTLVPEKQQAKGNILKKNENIESLKLRTNKIKIEKIRKEFISEKFFGTVEKIIREKNTFLDNVNPVSVNDKYIALMKELKNIISSTKINTESRKIIRETIDSRLKENYSIRKQSKEAPRQNIKLFDPHLVFYSDEIHK